MQMQPLPDLLVVSSHSSTDKHTAIYTNTAFRLLTPPQSIPIVAALQSVGAFSHAFSNAEEKAVLRNEWGFFDDKWGEVCLA